MADAVLIGPQTSV